MNAYDENQSPTVAKRLKGQSVLTTIGAVNNLAMYSRSGRSINKAFNCFKDESKSEVDVLVLHDAKLRKDLRR